MRYIDTVVGDKSKRYEASSVLTVLVGRAQRGRLHHADTLTTDFVARAKTPIGASDGRLVVPNDPSGNRFANQVVFGFPLPLDVLGTKLVIAPVFEQIERAKWTTSVEWILEGELLDAFRGVRTTAFCGSKGRDLRASSSARIPRSLRSPRK
jgi:hypothetical protein